jgi:hypothetical protein
LLFGIRITLPQEDDFIPWREKREENKKAGGMLAHEKKAGGHVAGSLHDKKPKLSEGDGIQ